MKKFNIAIIILTFIIGIISLFLTGWFELTFLIVALPTLYALLHLLPPREAREIGFNIFIAILSFAVGCSIFFLTGSLLFSCFAFIPVFYSCIHIIVRWEKYKSLLLGLNIFLILLVFGGVTGGGFGDIWELMAYIVLPGLVVNGAILFCQMRRESVPSPNKLHSSLKGDRNNSAI